MVLAPFLIFGWVTGVPLGVAGAAISSLVAVAVGVGLARDLFHQARARTCTSSRAVEAAVPALEPDAEDRPAGRRRVRADGGVPVRRLLDQPAVRRRGPGRLRHRHARHAGRVHAGRRAGVLGRAGRRPELRRPAGRARREDLLHRRSRWRSA